MNRFKFQVSSFKLMTCLLAMCLLSPVALTGCKSSAPVTPVTLAYQTLGSVGAAVDAATKIVAAAQVKGTITAAQGAQYGVKHDQFNAAYNLAVALAATATDNGLAMPAPADVLALYGDLQNLLANFKLIP